MRPQKRLLADVESVARITCGMAGRDVECIEVVVRAFDFRTIFDGVAHRDENVFDFLADNRQRMAMSDALTVSRKADIDGFTFERAVLLTLDNRRLQCLQ